MPFCEIRLGGSPAMFSPLNRMRPAVGRSTPVRQLNKVLLPAPFGPMTARISPGSTSNETLLSAVKPPKRSVSPSVRRIGPATYLRELARRREDRLLLRHDLQDVVLAAPDVEDELPQERL